jgi:hypothetical protein
LNEPVIQATVALLKQDSTLVTNAVTNLSGVFQMTAPQNGQFILRVTYVGYKPLFRNLTISGQPQRLGQLTLEPDSKMLKNVEIVKNVARVQSKGDTLIYNADAFKTPEGSVVEELVKRLPGAEVDENGNITNYTNDNEIVQIVVPVDEIDLTVSLDSVLLTE